MFYFFNLLKAIKPEIQTGILNFQPPIWIPTRLKKASF